MKEKKRREFDAESSIIRPPLIMIMIEIMSITMESDESEVEVGREVDQEKGTPLDM